MTTEEAYHVDLEQNEGGEGNKAKSDTPVRALRREPSFSRWCDEDGGDGSKESRKRSKNHGEDGDFELPLLHIDASGNGNSFQIDQSDSRSQNFRQRSSHMNAAIVGNDSMSGGEADAPRNYAEIAGNGKKFSSFYVENENGSRSGSPRLWVTPPRDRNSGDSKFEAHDSRDPSGLSQVNTNNVSVRMVLTTLLYILVWYTFSTCLTVYNKTLLGDHLGKFPAPLLMNTVHFSMQAALSKAIVWFWSARFAPSNPMSWRDYFVKVVPTALGTALDINLSNASLVFISVTFATMCKSASPIFLLLFAFAFKLEALSLRLLGIIFIISVGVLLTVAKETEFEFWGFLFVMLASVMSGFRWSMTQILLQVNLKHKEDQYEFIWEIIDKRWDRQMHKPLHAAALYLNPGLYYEYEGIESNAEIKGALFQVINILTSSSEHQEKVTSQLMQYRSSCGGFGLQVAVNARKVYAPAEWWMSFGYSCPELQQFAIKILSLTCSASPCERNWSTFEMREVYGLKNPITLMSYVTPVMAFSTALLSLLFDPWIKFKQNNYFDGSWHIVRSCLLMLLGGGLAFCMVLTEYVLVSTTSAVTVTIAGVVKEAVTIVVAVFYFHDQFTLLKGLGLLIIMVGVSLFNWYKYQKLQKGHLGEKEESIGSPRANGSAKYVILDNMDEES